MINRTYSPSLSLSARLRSPSAWLQTAINLPACLRSVQLQLVQAALLGTVHPVSEKMIDTAVIFP
jgi:hypothetical protein